MRPGLTAGALGPSIVSLNANKSPPAPPPAAHVTRAVTSPDRASLSVSVVTNTVLGAYRTSGLPLVLFIRRVAGGKQQTKGHRYAPDGCARPRPYAYLYVSGLHHVDPVAGVCGLIGLVLE